jgi:hypothetical protein
VVAETQDQIVFVRLPLAPAIEVQSVFGDFKKDSGSDACVLCASLFIARCISLLKHPQTPVGCTKYPRQSSISAWCSARKNVSRYLLICVPLTVQRSLIFHIQCGQYSAELFTVFMCRLHYNKLNSNSAVAILCPV